MHGAPGPLYFWWTVLQCLHFLHLCLRPATVSPHLYIYGLFLVKIMGGKKFLKICATSFLVKFLHLCTLPAEGFSLKFQYLLPHLIHVQIFATSSHPPLTAILAPFIPLVTQPNQNSYPFSNNCWNVQGILDVSAAPKYSWTCRTAPIIISGHDKVGTKLYSVHPRLPENHNLSGII